MLKFTATAATALAAALIAPLSAAAQTVPPAVAEATQGPSNVAVWKTGDEDTTVYLMGTVHILTPGLEWENETFRNAWSESDTVYFEADVISPDAIAAVGPVLMSSGFYTDGRTFADLFTEEETKTLNEGLKTYGVTVKSIGNLRPWLASIQLAQSALSKAGGSADAGIEMILGQRAAIEGKELAYFETAVEQIEMIAGIEDEVWATAMVEGIDELANAEEYFAQLIGLWYHGKADELADMMAEGWDETPELKTVLLDERNERWADELDTVIDTVEGSVFIAVGAGHLAGENSVQDYLEALGHSVERINP